MKGANRFLTPSGIRNDRRHFWGKAVARRHGALAVRPLPLLMSSRKIEQVQRARFIRDLPSLLTVMGDTGYFFHAGARKKFRHDMHRHGEKHTSSRDNVLFNNARRCHSRERSESGTSCAAKKIGSRMCLAFLIGPSLPRIRPQRRGPALPLIPNQL
jgi:hypothetical protein